MSLPAKTACPICAIHLKDVESHLLIMHGARWLLDDNGDVIGLCAASSDDGASGDVLLTDPLAHNTLTWKAKLANMLGAPLSTLYALDDGARCVAEPADQPDGDLLSWEERLLWRLLPRQTHTFVDIRGRPVSLRRITVVELNRQYRMEQVMLGYAFVIVAGVRSCAGNGIRATPTAPCTFCGRFGVRQMLAHECVSGTRVIAPCRWSRNPKSRRSPALTTRRRP